MRFGSQFGFLGNLILAIILSSWPAVSASAQGSTGVSDFEDAANFAAAAREAGHADEAIQAYQRALRLRPEWAEGWWYLATLLYDQNRYSQAIPAFQNLLELVPNAGPAWDFLGLCEFETKDYENSRQHMQKGLSLGDADDPETAAVAKYHLSLLLIRNAEFDNATTLLASSFGQKEIGDGHASGAAVAQRARPFARCADSRCRRGCSSHRTKRFREGTGRVSFLITRLS
jgi:tetratricopeptide (TPR) repeat protein